MPHAPTNAVIHPWEIAGARVRIGQRVVELSRIRAVRRFTARERDRAGGLLIFVLFCVVLWVFTVGVFELGWRMRFLLGAIVALMIAATGLEDTFRANRIDLHEVEIDLACGERLVFTTADPFEADALAAALQ